MTTASPTARSDLPPARFRVALALALAALVAAYWREFVYLERIWRHRDEWSYGYLIIPLAVAILTARMRRFPEIPLRPSPVIGLLLVAVGLAIRYAALWAGILSISWASMVIIIGGLVWGICGTRFMRIAYVPVAYLVLMFPWPSDLYEKIALPMQRAATHGSIFALELVGIAAHREGNVIHLHGGSLEVAQACSGLRLLLAFVSVATAMAFLVDRPRWQKIVIILSSLPVALLANMTRVVTTALAFQWFGAEAAGGWFHDGAGYAMIFFAFGLFWFELWFLSRVVEEEPPPAATGAPSGEAAAVVALQPPVGRRRYGRPILVALALAAPLLVIGCTHRWIEKAIDRGSALQPFVEIARPLSEFPDHVLEFGAEELPLDSGIAKALKADDHVRRLLVAPDGNQIGTVFISYNGMARQFYTHRPAICMPNAGWTQISREERTAGSDGIEPFPYARMVFSRSGNKIVVLDYFNVSGRIVTRIEALRLLMARPGRSYACQVMVGLRVPWGTDPEDLDDDGPRILAGVTELLREFLPSLDGATDGEEGS